MKVGVIGLGVMGKNHARVLSNMSNISDLVLFDPLGDQLGLVHGVTVESDIDKFLDQELDYCVVSSPTSTHLEMGLKLAARNIATLIEKPLANNEEEGQKLVEAFDNAGVIAGVGHVERFNPAIMAMKEKLEAGVLGDVYQIATRRVGPYSGRIRDVGVVKDLASHDIDLVGWLSQSNYENLNSRTLKPMGNEHEDILLAIGTLGNGSLVSHLVNWISPTKERVTSVLGEKGMLVADTLSVDLYFFEKGSQPTNWDGISIFKGTSEGATHKFELAKNEPLVNEHLAFQKSIVDKNSVGLATLSEGLEVLRVAERLARG
jgi:UDP-N-acetylglucosamine 3-dehydrogenase